MTESKLSEAQSAAQLTLGESVDAVLKEWINSDEVAEAFPDGGVQFTTVVAAVMLARFVDATVAGSFYGGLGQGMTNAQLIGRVKGWCMSAIGVMESKSNLHDKINEYRAEFPGDDATPSMH